MERRPDPIDVEVGARVRLRRKTIKLSQQALAQSLGLTFQQVQKYERGTNRMSASMLVKTAERLETTVADLVGETERAGASGPALSHLLAVPGAIELLTAYAYLPETRLQRAIVHLVQATAATSPVKDAA